MAKAGRPKIQIDYRLVEELANIFCTQEEIARILGISADTLQRDKEFSGIYKKGHENAKCSLRRFQFKLAETKVGMAIWLGKQYLGQTDTTPVGENNWTTQMKIEGLDGSVI